MRRRKSLSGLKGPTAWSSASDFAEGRLRLERLSPNPADIPRDFLMALLIRKWIDDGQAGVLEICAVPGDQGQTVNDCSCGNEAVFNRHGFAIFTKARQKFCPFQAGGCVPRQAVELFDAFIKPVFEGRSLLSFGQ